MGGVVQSQRSSVQHSALRHTVGTAPSSAVVSALPLPVEQDDRCKHAKAQCPTTRSDGGFVCGSISKHRVNSAQRSTRLGGDTAAQRGGGNSLTVRLGSAACAPEARFHPSAPASHALHAPLLRCCPSARPTSSRTFAAAPRIHSQPFAFPFPFAERPRATRCTRRFRQ